MKENKPLIVVLSRNYSTGLSVVRCLGTAGYMIELVASANKEHASRMVASSRYVKTAVEVVTTKVKDEDDIELLNKLLDYKGVYEQKPVLFPTDDYTTTIVDLNRNVLQDIFIMPRIINGKQGELKHYMNKSIQSEIARKVGLLTPKEWVVSLRDDEIIIPEDMVFPCFCKPLESSLGYKREMKKCDDIETLREHLMSLRMNYANRSILIQEFLEIDEEIDLDGVCLDQHIIMPSMICKWKRNSSQHNQGLPLLGKTYAISETRDFDNFEDKILRFLRELHYFGIFNIGFSVVRNKIYFTELNMRSSGMNFVYFKSGVNLPVLFVKGITGESHSLEEETIKEYGKSYIYEKVAWEDYLHGNMTKEELDENIEHADITNIIDADDPVPTEIFMENMKVREEKILQKEHRKELKEACINATVEATGWEREYAEEQIKAARERTGIKYKEYIKYEFWNCPPEQQAEKYEEIAKEKNRRKRQKKECIRATRVLTGWDRKTALQHINDAMERLGIDYNEYMRYNFCLIPEDKQIEHLEKVKVLKTDDYKPLVVVLSRNYSTGLSVIRSLGAAGYAVDLVASAYKEGRSVIASSSKYVRKSAEVVSAKVKDGGDEELVGELLKYADKYLEKPVLFPTDDYTTSIMDLNRDVLEKIFVMPSIIGEGQGALTKHMNKTVQGDLARKVGLLTPKEWIFSLREDIVIPEDMVYPCFVKPIESITGYKKEMKTCHTEEQLARHLRKLKKKFDNRSILIQEFLEIENEIDFSGVCLDQEIIIPAIIKKTNVAQYEKGVTLAGKVVPFEELEQELREKTIAMLKEFHYVGMFDMEYSIVGDKIYFNEVNLRSGGPNFSYFRSGVNLPALYVKEALGGEHTPEEEKVESYGKSFIYEKVAWDDYIHEYMTKKELNDTIAAADITLLCNDDDPIPGKIFTKNIKKTARRRKLRRMKRKIKRAIRRPIRKVLRWIKHRVLGYPQTKKKNRRDPNAEKPRVLVAGRNYCSNLCMARSLGEAGYEVEVLRIFQVRPKRKNLMKMLKPDAYSKYVKAYYVCVSRRRSKRIVRRLEKIADPDRKMLLIPADDLVAAIADRYYERLSECYIMPNVNDEQGEINRLMEKGVQKELALQAGLPVLNSCVIKSENGEFEIPESVTYPCFIKPNISKNSSKSRMRKCDDEASLREVLTEFAQKKDIEMLVEDYVEIGKEYSILGISTKEGVIGPGFFVAEQGGQNEHRGVAVTGRLLPCSEQQKLIDDILKFIESLNFDGLYDVDLIETVDGKMYFVELNMRFGASGYAVTKAGVNLPGMFADYMLFQKPIDMDCKIEEPGKTFVSEKVLIEEYLMSRLEMSKVKSNMREVDIHFVKNEEDMKPYKHFKKFYIIAKMMRGAYRRKEAKKEISGS